MKKLFGFALFVALIGAAIYFAKVEDKDSYSSSSRTPSSARAADPQQDSMNEVTKKILAMKAKEDVKKVIAEIGQIIAKPEYKGLPGPRIMAGIAKIVLPLEGIVWRSRKIVEPSDWFHATALFKLRTFASYDYLYGTHITALFDYLTQPPQKPNPGEREKGMFRDAGELQDYLAGDEVAGQLEGILRELYDLDKIPAEQFEFDFNRSLVTGVDEGLRYIDPYEVNRRFIKPYLYTITFLVERLLGTIKYVSVYDFNDLPAAANSVLAETAINSVKNRLRIESITTAKGVTPAVLFRAFEGHRKLFTLRVPEEVAKKSLDRAYELGKSAAANQLAAYVCGIRYGIEDTSRNVPNYNKIEDCKSFPSGFRAQSSFVPNGDRYLFNPNLMLIDYKSKYKAFIDRYTAYYGAKNSTHVTIVSDVTGRPVNVNVKALFAPHRDLKAFFPSQYHAEHDPGRMVDGKWVWDYHHGKPIEFKDPTFGGFFDNSVRSGADVYNNMTTLLYTDGLAPFAVFLRAPTPVRFIDFGF